jgi:hypothetical protein
MPPRPATSASAAPKGDGAVHLTRAEIDVAIGSRLHGASSKLVRDENKKPIGLRLYNVGALARFGVYDGDVLVAANGMALRTAEEALAALGALEKASRVVVTFKRGGAPFSIAVVIDP